MLEYVKKKANNKIVMAVIVAVITGATFYAGCPEEGDEIIDQVQEVIETSDPSSEDTGSMIDAGRRSTD